MLPLLTCVLGAAAAMVPDSPITNTRVSIDMVQNNPGDPVGWEQSKYFQPTVLKELGYTGEYCVRVCVCVGGWVEHLHLLFKRSNAISILLSHTC